jgi:glycosyltransferase involved in cell wall biosynthesis
LTVVVRLERPLPAALPAGSSTALFCTGVCFDTEEPVERLEILADGIAHRPAAYGMPRSDLTGAGAADPHAHRYRSGFWGTVPIRAAEQPGAIELEVAAYLPTGVVRAPIGTIEVTGAAPAPTPAARPTSPGPGLIAVCMATFEPDPSLFEAQLDSLRAQNDQRWICLISDDCSGEPHFEQIRQLVGDDPRFTISPSPARLGFYRNFERALGMVPREAELVALCDQDDRWHRDKLSVLRGSLGEATLAYSDQRLVTADGVLLRDTLWKGRRNNYDSLASILVANTITGAATLLRREIAELALPFPDSPGFQFHDHWLAAVALAAGEVAYVDRPLYDYVQHRGAVFGDVTHGSRRREHSERDRWSTRLRRVRAPNRARVVSALARCRAAYFYGYLAREVQARTLLIRCADRLSAPKRRTLERFVACDSSMPALIWLLVRPLRCVAGRTETLGSEIALAQGVAWKRLATALARSRRPIPARLADASPPPLDRFSQKRLRRWRAQV